MRFGSLFAGIGGLDLGLERAGMECAWQVEIDSYARRVLEKHWPDVRRWDDVRTFPPEPIDDWRVDLICGGFPCQDISAAGTRVGIEGERSGLWREMLRVVRAIRPRYVVVENSPDIVHRGLGVVLGDLATNGFDADWRVLSAGDSGAPHIRERMFIVGYPGSVHWNNGADAAEREQGTTGLATRPVIADPDDETARQAAWIHAQRTQRYDPTRRIEWNVKRRIGAWCGWESATPELCRVDDGIPGTLDRLRCLGNAVVPQVAEWIGRRILESMD